MEWERDGVLRRTTRRTGRFELPDLLPTHVKAKGGSTNKGVLTVTVDKAQAVKPRHTSITES
jgi:HSP20 family protein